jgi:transcriptional regulator with XRE-family HTH domain
MHCPSTALCPENAVVSAGLAGQSPILHYLRSVREREGISIRSVARHLHVNPSVLKAQEVETTDLPLSVLHQWAAALNVPIVELVAEPTTELSLPLLNRARLLRVMKTARAILEQSSQLRVKRTAQMLVEQLVDLMPELAEVIPWNSTGSGRRRRDLGRAARLRLPAELMRDLDAGRYETRSGSSVSRHKRG